MGDRFSWGVRVTGDRDLIRELDDLGERAARAVVRAALRKAGRVVMKDAKERLAKHVRTGRLQRAVEISVLAGQGYVDIGYRSRGPRGAPHGVFAEVGTSHSAAFPFLRPALEAKREEATEIFRAEIERQIIRRQAAIEAAGDGA